MMTLSTTSAFLFNDPQAKTRYPMRWGLDTLHAAGFTCLDANLWAYTVHGHPMGEDGWRDWLTEMKAHADELGIIFRQTHGKTLTGMEWDDPDYPEWDYFEKMTLRCIEATKILGAEWMVMHPTNCPHDPIYSSKRAKEKNLFYLEPYIEAAKRIGIGIAIENMVDFRASRRRYCGGDPEELLDLVDTIHDPAVGICIDTGHANLSGIHAGTFIRMAGDRLKCTHIDDNNRDRDSHLPPYFGSVDWQDVMQALKDIHYDHDFSFELACQHFPRESALNWCRFVYNMGTELLAMAQN